MSSLSTLSPPSCLYDLHLSSNQLFTSVASTGAALTSDVLPVTPVSLPSEVVGGSCHWGWVAMARVGDDG